MEKTKKTDSEVRREKQEKWTAFVFECLYFIVRSFVRPKRYQRAINLPFSSTQKPTSKNYYFFFHLAGDTISHLAFHSEEK